MKPYDGKIFCIGFNKTGTTSLHRAFEKLGYKSLHWAPEGVSNFERGALAKQIIESINQNLDNGLPLLTSIEDYDAYSDIFVLAKNFKILDAQYGGSKFILNTRSSFNDWLRSRIAHEQRAIRRARAAGRLPPRPNINIVASRIEWQKRHAMVRSYFQDRPDDFLEIDIPGGDGYDQLCPFLNVPHPGVPFPRKNITAENKD